MKNESVLQKALNIAYKFLSYRPRTEQEIRSKLLSKKCDTEVIEDVVKKLKEMDYLNDREFCKMWVNYRLKLKPMGKNRLYQELLQKGVSKSIIQEVLDEELTPQIEEQLAREIIKKQISKYMNKNDRLDKLKAFMVRRGFKIDMVIKILEEYTFTKTGW